MGFLKKKPSIRLPNEMTRTASKSGASGGVISPPSASSLPAANDDRRDDGSASGMWTEAESRMTPSRASVSSASREKMEEKVAAAAATRHRKKHSSTSLGEKIADRDRSSKGDGKRSKSPLAIGLKKVSGSDRKKKDAATRGRSRSASLSKRREEQSGEAAAKKRGESKDKASRVAKDGGKKGSSDKKKSSSDHAHKKKARDRSKSKDKVKRSPRKNAAETGATGSTSASPTPITGKKAAASEAMPKVKNSHKTGKPPSKSKDRSTKSPARSSRPSRPASAPASKASASVSRRGRPASAPLRKRFPLSDDETSCSGRSGTDYSGSFSDSSYYSESEVDMEECTTYTDDDGTTDVDGSIGYNTTEDEDYMTDGIGQSASSGSEVSHEGLEVSSTGCTSYESEGTRSTMLNQGKVRGRDSGGLAQAARESLSALGVLAGDAMKDKEEGNGTASPSDEATDSKDGEESSCSFGMEDKDNISGRDTPSSKGGTMVTGSTYEDFMKKMEDFVAQDIDHQLKVQVRDHGNVEKLELQEIAYIPKPSRPDEIVVKVDCSTITLQDCMIRRGKWYEMQSLPFTPGSDIVGTIHSMGMEATKCSTFRVGDKVAAVVPSGGNAKYINLPYHGIIRVPTEADSVIALCLSSTYVPAREALDLARKLNTPFTGANILVIGGNGPSGLATIEMALLEGANVFATADERHHDYLTNMGAKCFPIDPKKWLPTLQGKMDVVLDSVCLDGYESSSLALNSAGTLVCTGMSAVYTQGQIRAFGMRDVRDYKAMYCKMRAKYMLSNAVYYDRMERYEQAPNEYAQHFRYLCHLASKDSIKPLVSSRSPLNLVASTQKAIEHGDTSYGVCICLPWTTKVIGEEESAAIEPHTSAAEDVMIAGQHSM